MILMATGLFVLLSSLARNAFISLCRGKNSVWFFTYPLKTSPNDPLPKIHFFQCGALSLTSRWFTYQYVLASNKTILGLKND